MDFTPEARRYIGEVGYDPEYGARPLKRAIQKEIENPLARYLLKEDIVSPKVVRINVVSGKVEFESVRELPVNP